METSATGTEMQKKSPVQDILDTVKKVILTPAEFFRGMAKIGGFVDPLIFVVVMGVVGGIIQAVLGLVHLGVAVSVLMALGSIIFAPIMIVIGSFIGAFILFIIWKLMGSNESFEVAYRCCAYAAAISPITTLLGIIPYVGALAGLAWGLYLMVMASVEVHKIDSKKAWMVFGIIGAILALFSLGSSCAARKVQRDMGAWQKEMGVTPGKSMTPEEAGKAAASFMKAMQEQARKDAEKAKAESQE